MLDAEDASEFDFERSDPTTDIDDYLRECVRVNGHDLNGEFRRVSADTAYWTQRFAEAWEQSARCKADYERERARTRLELKEGSARKYTREDLDAAVSLDDEVVDAHIVYVVAEARRLKLRGVVDAISAKKDMLQSLGAKLRAEMMSDPVLREQLAAQSSDGLAFDR